jgi:hypothetical protein
VATVTYAPAMGLLTPLAVRIGEEGTDRLIPVFRLVRR